MNKHQARVLDMRASIQLRAYSLNRRNQTHVAHRRRFNEKMGPLLRGADVNGKRTAIADADVAGGPAPSPPSRTPRPRYCGYFERQEPGKARCGMHALNNAMGGAVHSTSDMARACNEYLRASRQEGNPEFRCNHENAAGWYSSEVMAQAVTTTAMRRAGRVEHVLLVEPLQHRPEALVTAVGAVVNVNNAHWVALRYIGGHVWLLDSQQEPLQVTWEQYESFIGDYPHAYRIERARDMRLDAPALDARAP